MTKQELYLILDNVRSAYNVGSIFRTADGTGVNKMYLCGITPTPDRSKVHSPQPESGEKNKVAKTALGAEKVVLWEYRKQIWRLVEKLKGEGVLIIALEQTKKSENIFNFKPPKNKSIALIIGNEVAGVNKKILSRADKIVEIPMRGEKESLNVAVAAGIALYNIVIRNKLIGRGNPVCSL